MQTQSDIREIVEHLRAQPLGEDAFAELRQRYEPDALARLYVSEANHVTGTEDQLVLLMEAARLRAEALDDLDSAVLLLRRALKIVPNDAGALYMLAQCLVERGTRGDTPEHARDLRRAAELFYRTAKAVDPPEADEYLQMALECHPDHAQAKAMRRELATARPAPAAAEPEIIQPEPGRKHDSLTPAPVQRRAEVCPEHDLQDATGRQRLSVELGEQSASNLYVGLTGSVSSGGVYAMTKELMPRGTKLDVGLRMQDGFQTRFFGEVEFLVRASEQGPTPAGMGIRFERIPANGLRRLERWARQRAPKFYDPSVC